MGYDLAYSVTRAARRPVPAIDGRQAIHVDPRVAVHAVGIFLFSALDAGFTLTLVNAGVAAEVNPFMRLLLETDAQLFINVKLIITAVALVFLAIYSDHTIFGGRVRVDRIIAWLLCGYALLIGWEIVIALSSIMT